MGSKSGRIRPHALPGFVVVLALFACAWPLLAQIKPAAGEQQGEFKLQLRVDEVVLTFHAQDAHGVAVNDIQQTEVRVLDNGKAPRRIISFDLLADRPIRAALMLDTSESMQQSLPIVKSSAEDFASRIFRQKSDQAMVMDFAYTSDFLQPWTADASALSRSVRNVRLGRMNPLPGTAILDAVFKACYYGFNQADPSATGNFILLFSDGEDNVGHASVEEVERACQRSNTAIYAFLFEPPPGQFSPGPKTLRDLANQTGGKVFPADDSPETIRKDLEIMEGELRNQYRLVYSPANLEHNGAFHSIELQLPDRVSWVEVRPGYLAPAH